MTPTPECKEVNGICITHKQQLAACWQMTKGNLCSACKEWHTKDYNCKKKN